MEVHSHSTLENFDLMSENRCRPGSGLTYLGDRRTITKEFSTVADEEASNCPPNENGMQSYVKPSLSRKRNLGKDVCDSNTNQNNNKSNKNNVGFDLKDLGIAVPNDPKHMGIFQFMKFSEEHVEQDKEEKDQDTTISKKEILKHILHSKALHIIIVILVIVDILLVLFEVLLDVNVIQSTDDDTIREVFHGFSIGILNMFMIEIALKFYVDHYHFIRHKIELFDALVVIVSWFVDVILVFMPNVNILAAELLILLRLWRVLRIINGIILAVKTKADEKVHEIKMLNEDLERFLHESEEEIEKLTKDVEYLTSLLKKHDIDVKETKI